MSSSMLHRFSAAALVSSLIVLAPLSARAQLFHTNNDADAERAPDQLVLKYTATAGQRRLTGSVHKLQWNVVTLSNGSAKVLLRIPIDALESGDAKFDKALRQSLDADRFPVVEVEGLAQGGAGPVRFNGVIRAHNHAQPFAATLSVSRQGTQLAASTQLVLELDQLGIDLPQLEGDRIEPKLAIEFSVLLSLHPQAVVSGGFIATADARDE